MSEEIIKRKKERIKRFLNWLRAQRQGATKYQLNEWLFDNYAFGERTREKYLRDLIHFQYIIVKGNKFRINSSKAFLF